MEDLTNHTVLIVDKSRLQALVMQRMFEGLDFTVLHATDNERAKHIVQEQHIDVIVVDYVTLIANGNEAASQVANIDPQGRAKVVVFAANTQVNNEDDFTHWADAVLKRSSDENQLVSIINDLLNCEHTSVESELLAENERLKAQLKRLSGALAADQNALNTQKGFMINLNHDVRTLLNAVLGLTYLIRQKSTGDDAVNHSVQLEQTAIQLLKVFEYNLKCSELASDSARTICERVLARCNEETAERIERVVLEPGHDTDALTGPTKILEEILYSLILYGARHVSGEPVILAYHARRSTNLGKVTLRFEVKFPGTSKLVQSDSEYTDLSILHDNFDLHDSALLLASSAASYLGGKAVLEQRESLNSIVLTVELEQLSDDSQTEETAYTVVIVDDEPINRRMTTSVLEQKGIKVVAFSGGHDVVNHFQETENNYDLVLMDLIMPGLSGVDATTMIRKIERWKTIPIVAMSATIDTKTQQTCKEAGMNDFFVKSSDPSELYEKLDLWLYGTGIDSLGAKSHSSNMPAGSEQQQTMMRVSRLLPMIDIKNAVRLGVLDDAVFTPLITEFERRYKQSPCQLMNYISKQDYTNARLLAHSIKGAAATLGLTEIAEQATDIESALVNAVTSELRQSTAKLECLMEQFVEAFERWQTVCENESSETAINSEQMLEQLTKFLCEDDPFARDYFEKHIAAVKRCSMALYEKLDEATANYDLVEALRVLTDYRSALTSKDGGENVC